MATFRIILFALFCFYAVWPLSQTSAQVQPQPALQHMVQQELRRLKQRLEATAQILRAYQHQQAQELLRQAENIAKRAHRLYQLKKYREARQQIQQAFMLLDKAIRIALRGPIRRYLNQLRSLMRIAENTVIGSGNREAERLVQEAKKRQRAGDEAYKRGEYAHAVELYWMAILNLERAIKLVQAGVSAVPGREVRPMDYNRLFRDRFETLATRVHEALQNARSPRARTIYQQAIRQARKAEEAHRAGKQRMAQHLLNGAYRLLLRALDLASGQSGLTAGYLKNELRTLEMLLARIQETGETRGRSPNARLLQRARELLTKARQAMDAGDHAAAQNYLKLSRGILTRLLRTERSKERRTNEQRISRELETLERDIEKAGVRFKSENLQIPLEILTFARQASSRAREHYRRGEFNLALQNIMAAQRFLNRALTLGRGQRPVFDRNMIEQKINQLKEMIGRLETETGPGADRLQPVIRQTRDLVRQAEERLRRNDNLMAYELCDVAMELLKKAVRMTREP